MHINTPAHMHAFIYIKSQVMDNMDIGTSLYDEEGAKIVASLVEKAKVTYFCGNSVL